MEIFVLDFIIGTWCGAYWACRWAKRDWRDFLRDIKDGTLDL